MKVKFYYEKNFDTQFHVILLGDKSQETEKYFKFY